MENLPKHIKDIKKEDFEQLADICEQNGNEEKANEIRDRLND